MDKAVNDIINALGGTGNLANLLGVNPSAVSNYRRKGFPARLHLKIIALCEEYSIPIKDNLFGGAKISLRAIKKTTTESLANTSHSILNNLSSDNYEIIDPPILVSADKVLDRLGESIADKLYIFSQHDGVRVCLRPDLTIPTCLYYLDHGYTGEKKLFSYFGKVFQFHGEDSNEAFEYSQAGIESIGDKDKINSDVEVFYKISNALQKEGLKNYNTYFGDVSLFREFIKVLDIADLWKEKLLEKFWNDNEFKDLLVTISNKKKLSDDFSRKIYSLDKESAEDLVRGTINAVEESSYAGRSVEEITDRLRQKGEEFSIDPLSSTTEKLIREFLSISDQPLKALDKLKKLCKSLDGSLLEKIEETVARFEKIQNLGVNFNKAIFSPEKGRDVEYYTGFLFDFVGKNNSENLYIGGGGRYDGLIKSLGSKLSIPAVGAALNMKRVERFSNLESLR